MKNNLNTLIIALAVVISAVVLGRAWKGAHEEKKTISVSGLAKQDFISDLIVWQGYLTAEDKTTKLAYADLKRDTGIFKKYIISKGINEKEIEFSSVDVNTDYDYVYVAGVQTKKFKGYILTQNLKVESKEVDKVENISREVSELIDRGVNFITQSTEYYYSKMDELKIKMLSTATEEARNRAEVIANNAKSKLGELIHSEMSDFKVNAKNSAEEFTEAGNDEYSNGEVFNTTSKKKTATVNVKLDFRIQ